MQAVLYKVSKGETPEPETTTMTTPDTIEIRGHIVQIDIETRTIGREESGGMLVARLDAGLTAALGIQHNPDTDDLDVAGWMAAGDLRCSVIDDVSALARRTDGVSMVRIYVRARNRWWGFFEVLLN